jgi:hypothetical protein
LLGIEDAGLVEFGRPFIASPWYALLQPAAAASSVAERRRMAIPRDLSESRA